MFLPVTAIIPLSERPLLVREAIASVLRGSFLPKELIVVLSPSSPPLSSEQSPSSLDRLAVEDILKPENIAQISQHKALGLETQILFCKTPYPASARNMGARHAKQPWLAFLDSDDLWHRDKLQKQWEYLKKRPQLRACHSREKWLSFSSLLKQPSHLKARGGVFLKAAFSYCLISPSALFIHKETFQKLGAFDESFEVCEDFEFFLRYLKDFPIGLCGGPPLLTKCSGNWPQLSKKYHSMDLWRIRALFKFLQNFGEGLRSDEREAAMASLKRKIAIVKKGALARSATSRLRKL